MKNTMIVDIFNSNNKNLKVEDILSNVRIGKTSEGITILRFNTVDKYHYVVDNGQGMNDTYISIGPVLLDNERTHDKELYENDFDAYIKHPDYYFLQLKVDVSDCNIIITPLKHEYQITFIPNSMIFGKTNLESVKL